MHRKRVARGAGGGAAALTTFFLPCNSSNHCQSHDHGNHHAAIWCSRAGCTDRRQAHRGIARRQWHRLGMALIQRCILLVSLVTSLQQSSRSIHTPKHPCVRAQVASLTTASGQTLSGAAAIAKHGNAVVRLMTAMPQYPSPQWLVATPRPTRAIRSF